MQRLLDKGKDAAYTKIACCRTYKVKNTNADLINYKNAFAESNAYFAKACVSAAVAAAVLTILCTIIGVATVINVALGISIAGLLVSLFGFGMDSAYALIDSYLCGVKARTYYDAAKLAAV